MLLIGETVQLGTVADWLAAIGTVGTLAITLTILRKEVGFMREERETARKAQAEAVAAWLDQGPTFGVTGTGFQSDTVDGWTAQLHVRNASSSPVYHCVALVHHSVGGPVDEPDHPDHQPYRAEFETLAPLGTVDRTIPSDSIDVERLIESGLTVSLHFTDSGGRHWERSIHGDLIELDSPRVLL